jgi:glutamine amidotransferase
MCRWLGYSGAPIALEHLLLDAEHSLIKQSLASKEGAETTNGDGFGVGWYLEDPEPGLYKDVRPAWNDRNLRDLSRHIRSRLFLAHVRATTGSPVQQTNCHPFRHGNWMMVHNGLIRDFARVKRDLVLEIDPVHFPHIEGTTDSEIMFYLALTFGLEKEPIAAIERMTRFVEKVGRSHDVEDPMQMTLGITDGTRLYAVRYSSERNSRSLYHSENMRALRALYPEHAARFSDDTMSVVSEPLGDLPGAWIKVPESTVLCIEAGNIEQRPFAPH